MLSVDRQDIMQMILVANAGHMLTRISPQRMLTNIFTHLQNKFIVYLNVFCACFVKKFVALALLTLLMAFNNYCSCI